MSKVLSFLYADETLAYLSSTDGRPIDVDFLEINMPRMNGFEFLEAATRSLGEEFARIVVVMLPTSLERSDRERAASCSVVRRFIDKPLTREHLSDAGEILREMGN